MTYCASTSVEPQDQCALFTAKPPSGPRAKNHKVRQVPCWTRPTTTCGAGA